MARVVAQRVRSASVTVGGRRVGSIGVGLVILLGIRRGDTDSEVNRLADKMALIRIFDDQQGKMNLAASDVGGSMLVVSQFTLYADGRRGRRPSFAQSAPADIAEPLYEQFASRLSELGYPVERGEFGAHMTVAMENDGPVTIVLDSDEV
jgi:D-tyrosyl-tRNA(Tyr) deacylase